MLFMNNNEKIEQENQFQVFFKVILQFFAQINPTTYEDAISTIATGKGRFYHGTLENDAREFFFNNRENVSPFFTWLRKTHPVEIDGVWFKETDTPYLTTKKDDGEKIGGIKI